MYGCSCARCWRPPADEPDVSVALELAVFWRDYVESGLAQRDYDLLCQKAQGFMDRMRFEPWVGDDAI